MNKLYRVMWPKFILLAMCICSLFWISKVNAQVTSNCDYIEVLDLRGIFGYAQPDEIVVCGAPDTLALIIFTDSPDPLPGTQLTVNLPSGLQYGDFVYSNNGGTASLLNGTDPKNPVFLLGTLDQSMPNVVYIGVTGDCNYTFNPEPQYIDLEIDYFDPQSIPCTQNYNLTPAYNGSIKVPILNKLSLTPQTINVNTSEQEFCHTMLISQDGIEAHVDSFTFDIQGIELQAELNFTMNANGIPVTGYDYDPVNDILLATIDATHFVNNYDPLCPTCIGDGQFDENEQVEVELCYEMVTCPINNTYNLEYNIYHSCFDKTCVFDDPVETEVNINPNFGANPIFQMTRTQEPSFCGDEMILDWYLTTNKTDSLAGLYQDLKLYIETCDSRRVDYSEVSIGGTVLPAAVYDFVSPSVYQLNIDLSQLNVDPDGPGGLDDIDNDGIYDDLAGGDTIRGQIIANVNCDPDGCFELTCDLNWGGVRSGKRHCGNDFGPTIDYYAPVIYTRMRETARFTNDTMRPSDNYGYSYIVTDIVDPGTQTPFLVEHGYAYEELGIQSCTESGGTTRTYLKVVATAQNLGMLMDVEFKPGSASWDGTPIPDTDVTTIFDAVNGTKTFIFDAGDESVQNLSSYLYELQVDSCLGSFRWMYLNSFVIQECTCADGSVCETVKSCEYIPVWINYTGCGYCEISMYSQFRRKSTGFTDASMTTQVAQEDIHNDDYNRYMPCDTISVCMDGRMRQDGIVYDSLNFHIRHIYNNPNTGYWSTLAHVAGAAAFDVLENTIEFSFYEQSTGITHYPTCAIDFDDEWWNNWVKLPSYNYHYEIADLSNCLSELPDTFYVEDTLKMKFDMVIFHNPNRDDFCEGYNGINLAPPDAEATPNAVVPVRIGGGFRGIHPNDPNIGTTGSSGVACNDTWTWYQFDCPEINAYSNYKFDECNDTVEHVWQASVGPPTENWYQNEFRPIYDLYDISSNIPTGTYYKANSAMVIYPEGTLPLMEDNLIDFTCQGVMGTDYCFETPGGDANVVFDGTTLRDLAVGMGNNDSIKIQYCVGTLCPSPANTEGLDLDWSYQYLTCPDEYGVVGETINTTTINNLVDYVGTPSMLSPSVDAFVITPVGATQTNKYSICVTGGSMPHNNLGTQITLPNNIGLVSITDANTGAIYTFDQIDQTLETITYAFDGPLELLEGECWEVLIETEFLYCIAGRDNVSVELYTFSGCLPADIRGELLTGEDENCEDARDYYIYELEPSDVQLDWAINPPVYADLCDTITMAMLYKNVKVGANYDQLFEFWFPNQGFTFVPNSFQMSYPGGPTNIAPPVSIPNPTFDPTVNPAYGDYYSIDINSMDPVLATIGLAGVDQNSAVTDSNKILIYFQVTTTCDDFVSGAVVHSQIQSLDNCQRPLESNIIASNPLIIDGADPNVFPQFLMFSGVDRLACGETTMNVGGINLSNTGVSDGNSEVRITLPPGVNYQPNSLTYTTPSGYVPDFIVDTLASGVTSITTTVPAGLELNDVFSMDLDVVIDETALCDTLVFEALVTSRVDDIQCIGTGEFCPVLVQSTLNPLIDLIVTPQLAVNAADMLLDCTSNPAISNLEYVLESENLGGDLANQPITINIYQDLDQDGEITPGLDGLLASDNQFITVDAMSDVTISGNVAIPSTVSCPLVVEYVFDGVCECNEMTFPIDGVRFKTTEEMGNEVGVCRGNTVAIYMCPNFDFDFSPSVPPADYYTSGDSLYFTPSPSQSMPVQLTIAANLGECDFEEIIQITDADGVGLNAGPDLIVCATSCTNLVALLDNGTTGGAEYLWYPSNGLDDPTIYNPEFCPSSGAGFYRIQVVATLPDGCIKRDTLDIEVINGPGLTLEMDTSVYCLGDSLAIKIQPDTFNTYILYYQDPISGLDIPVGSDAINKLFVYENPGTYYIQANPNDPTDCPGVSDPFEIGEVIPVCNNPGIEPNKKDCQEE